MNIYYEEDHGGGERRSKEVPLSRSDARLKSDLDAIIDSQKKQIQEDSLGAQIDAAEHQKLAEEAMAELTDTSEAHLYLRLAQELIPEKEIAHSYREVIKLAITYIRIGEIDEAMRLVDKLDLPSEEVEQDIEWNERLDKIFTYCKKDKVRHTKLMRWNFAGTAPNYKSDQSTNSLFAYDAQERQVLDKIMWNATTENEKKFAEQFGLFKFDMNGKKLCLSAEKLLGMSPKEYAMAIIAYYSNWMGGISTTENVKKFASTLKRPEKDFSVDPTNTDGVGNSPNFSQEYSALSAYYKSREPSVLGQIARDGFYAVVDPNNGIQRKTIISKPVLISFLCNIALNKYDENPHDVADDEDKETIGV